MLSVSSAKSDVILRLCVCVCVSGSLNSIFPNANLW